MFIPNTESSYIDLVGPGLSLGLVGLGLGLGLVGPGLGLVGHGLGLLGLWPRYVKFTQQQARINKFCKNFSVACYSHSESNI